MGDDVKESLLSKEELENAQPERRHIKSSQTQEKGVKFMQEIIAGMAQIWFLGKCAQRNHIKRNLESKMTKNNEEEKDGYTPPEATP